MKFCMVGLCTKMAEKGWMSCPDHRGQHWSDRFGALLDRASRW